YRNGYLSTIRTEIPIVIKGYNFIILSYFELQEGQTTK
ncbi:hypothetical protein LCGC14_2568280, partial [marine sediment metagenome]